MGKRKVLYLLYQYPQASQTYVENELRALGDDYEVMIVTANPADMSYQNHRPFTYMPKGAGVLELVKSEKFDLIHTHWMLTVPFVFKIARATDTPFTVRAHSFESYVPEGRPAPVHLKDGAGALNSDLCLKGFCLPYTRPSLLRVGIRPDKLEDYFPIIDYAKFLDRSPNGDAIMNLGACTPKKKMEDYVDLGVKLSAKKAFNLYAVAAAGREIDRVRAYNEQQGSPVRMLDAVEPDGMPAEYKKHQWLVYTACPKINQVGWPLALAEAMASGVGVCMAEIRPDLRSYVGDAAILYRDVSELEAILTEPVPSALRDRGFAAAERCDIGHAVKALKAVWSALPS